MILSKEKLSGIWDYKIFCHQNLGNISLNIASTFHIFSRAVASNVLRNVWACKLKGKAKNAFAAIDAFEK